MPNTVTVTFRADTSEDERKEWRALLKTKHPEDFEVIPDDDGFRFEFSRPYNAEAALQRASQFIEACEEAGEPDRFEFEVTGSWHAARD
jgi:hypothetical protein